MSPVVELFGLPGAGKTTQGRALAARLAARGDAVTWRSNHAVGRLPRSMAAARRAAHDPVGATRLARGIVRSGQGSPDQVVRRLVGWYATQAVVVAAPADRVLLLDEGVLQCLWSIGLVGDLDPVLDTLARADWVGPDRVAVLDVPLDEVRRRLDRRDTAHSRLDRVDPHERSRWLERGEDLVRRLLARYCTRAPTTTVVTTTTTRPMTRADVEQLVTGTVVEPTRPDVDATAPPLASRSSS